MSATYDQTHPTARDRVRANLGDTAVMPGTKLISAEDALHSNEHMDAVLSQYGEALGQAALAHELWARFAQEPQRITSQGDSLDLSAQLDVWSRLAQPWIIRQQAQATQASSTSGGGEAALVVVW